MNIPKEIFDCPDSFNLSRNNLPVQCKQKSLGSLVINNKKIVIGDKDGIELFAPIICENGTYKIYSYVWDHSRGEINVAIIAAMEGVTGGRLNEIHLDQNYAPHLDGLPVDSGAIKIVGGGQSFVIESGFGDGLYPVYGKKRVLRKPHAIVVDFCIWKIRNVILRSGWEFDKYHVAVEKSA